MKEPREKRKEFENRQFQLIRIIVSCTWKLIESSAENVKNICMKHERCLSFYAIYMEGEKKLMLKMGKST